MIKFLHKQHRSFATAKKVVNKDIQDFYIQKEKKIKEALLSVAKRDPEFVNRFPNRPSQRAIDLHPQFPHIFKDQEGIRSLTSSDQ